MGKIIFLPMEGNHEFLKTQIHSTFCKFGADQFGQMDGDFRNGFDLSYIQRNNAKHNYQQRWGSQSPPANLASAPGQTLQRARSPGLSQRHHQSTGKRHHFKIAPAFP
jgi:hypothetical protein